MARSGLIAADVPSRGRMRTLPTGRRWITGASLGIQGVSNFRHLRTKIPGMEFAHTVGSMRGLCLPLVVALTTIACASADGVGEDEASATSRRPYVDLDPTCGGPGQSKCSDGSCDEGTRFLNSSLQQCVACGKHGETFCYIDPKGVDPLSGRRCSDGTRFENSVQYACIACGHDGETYCYRDRWNFTSTDGYACGKGTRLDRTRFLCVACGNAWQTHCYADPFGIDPTQGKACAPGLYVDPASDLCVRP